MRWEELFDDLEAQLAAYRAGELASEVSDRIRRETATLDLVDRLRAAIGQPVRVSVRGAGMVTGRLGDCGPDWLLVHEDAERAAVLPLASVVGLTGVGRWAVHPEQVGAVARRLDLRWALRGLARARAEVSVETVDAGRLRGTIDRVGADHLDLAEHLAGEPRRPGAVRQVWLVPLPAVAVVRHR